MLVIIPMAGVGSRFSKYGFKKNKYLLPIDQSLTTMIDAAINSLNIKGCDFLFVIRKDQCKEVGQLPGKVVVLEGQTEGPATTVSLGLKKTAYEGPILVINSDQIMSWNPDAFLKEARNHDACVLTYRPDYTLVPGAEDKNSFLKKDSDGRIIKFSEKVVLSDEALVGIHYYKSRDVFFESYEYMYKHQLKASNGEYYISNTFQALVDLGKDVGSYILPEDEKYWPVGEPADYFTYISRNHYKIVGSNFSNYFFKTNPVKYYNLPGNYKVSGICVCTKGAQMSEINNISGELKVRDGEEFCVVETDAIIEPTNLGKFVRGWFVGNFHPTLLRTSDFEVGINIHKKTVDSYDFHYHEEVEEFNILIWGNMILNNVNITQGQYFNVKPRQITCSIYTEDTMILCVKSISSPKDKFLI